MDREFWLPVGGVAAVVALLIWAAVASERHQVEMIRGGTCKVDTSALYQPPPTFICSARDSKGGCLVMVPVQQDPYMRDHWKCAAGEQFWRAQ